MRTISRVRASLVTVSVVLLGLAFHVYGQSSVSPPSHAQMQPQVLSGSRPNIDQVLSGGLWRIDRSFQSSIQIYNRHIILRRTVIPVLYMADGTEYDLPPVDVAPNSLATISVHDAIESAPPQVRGHISLYGSASVHFLGPTTDSVSVAVQILDVANSLNFIYPCHASSDHMEASQHTFEGLWWRRDAGVTGFLGLANRTSTSIQVSLQAIGTAGTTTAVQTVVLGSHSSQLLSLDALTATLPGNQKLTGGLHVGFTGMSSDVMITGGLENQAEGYSALIPFSMHDADAASSTPSPVTLASTGIMVGHPDPAMKFPNGTVFFPYTYLRNVSASPMKVDRALYYTLAGGGGQRVKLPSLTINAGGAVHVPLDLGSIGLGGYNGQITESFSTVSNPGDLIVATGSTDQTANYVFEVLPRVAATTKSLQDVFWRVGGGYDTMTTLWNSGAAVEDLLITFSFAGGKGHYRLPVHLAPGASAAIDMADLISEAKPDSEGNIIPAGTSAGGMIVSGPNGLLDDIEVVLSGGIFSVFGATCNPVCYSCGPGLAQFSLVPSPVQSAKGGTTQMVATVITSGGVKETETTETKWSSQNVSVASVASGGMVTAVAGGVTTIDGLIQWPEAGEDACFPSSCAEYTYEGEAPVTVLVPTMVEPIATLSQGPLLCSNGYGWNRIVTNQLQYQNGSGVLQSGITMADALTFTSTNQLNLTPDTGSAPTDAKGSWSDLYADCGPKCPSSGVSDALQSWTWNGVGLPHVNLVVYKCTSVTIDGN
jgi:Bacterial Ig-like domain (group 2)